MKFLTLDSQSHTLTIHSKRCFAFTLFAAIASLILYFVFTLPANTTPLSPLNRAARQQSSATECLYDNGEHKNDEHINTKPPSVFNNRKENRSISLSLNDTLKLYRHNLSQCVAIGTEVPPEAETDLNLRRNLQCWCAERSPPDGRNCLFRLNNAIIHKRYAAKRAQVKTVVYVYSPSIFPLVLHVESSYPFEIRGYSQEGWHPRNVHRKTVKNGKKVFRPVSAVINDSSILMIPDAMHQENFYHSVMGPSGVMQIVATRGAINKFYSEMNQRLLSNHTRSRSNLSGEVTSLPSPSIEMSDFLGDFIRTYVPLRHNHSRFRDFPLRQKIDLEMWPVARCPLIPRLPSPLSDDILSNRSNSNSEGGRPLPSSYSSPTFLAKEILINHHHPMVNSPGAIASFEFMANELGFCQHLLPPFSYTNIEGKGNDLWIGKLAGPTGPLLEARRENFAMHLTRSERTKLRLENKLNASRRTAGVQATVDVSVTLTEELLHDPLSFAKSSMKESDPTPILMDEFASLCPVEEEEKVVTRWAGREIESVLRGPAHLESSKTEEYCTKVSRKQKGKVESFCVQVSGRPMVPLRARTRGLPPNIEIAILNALLTPLDNASTPLSQTLLSEQSDSRWWSMTSGKRAASCSNAQAPKSALSPSTGSTADTMLEALNHEAGLAPCVAPTTEQAATERAKYPNATEGMRVYEGLAFIRSSRWFDVDSIRRTDFSRRHVREQYAGVQATNLFIFEEGAAATWSMFAPRGSTFIIIYNSNVKRIDLYMNQAYQLAYQIDKLRNPKRSLKKSTETLRLKSGQEYRFTLPHVSQNISHTDHFLHQPDITDNVRMIFLIYQDGRLPSFARLREVFDWPWRAESIFVGCECDVTRIAPYRLVHGEC